MQPEYWKEHVHGHANQLVLPEPLKPRFRFHKNLQTSILQNGHKIRFIRYIFQLAFSSLGAIY